MDRFMAMRVFARVVEAGTFTKAADSLEMPKPTVTKLVQSLETHLRVKLLNRTTRQVTVTADGAAFYERAVRLLSELEDIEASMSNAQATPKGRLRVDVGTSVAGQIIIPALPAFHARYPDIQIDLGVSDRPVDLISDNVDCVVRGGELTDQSLVARRIGEFAFIAVATPDYLKRHGAPSHPYDLNDGHTVVRFFSPRTGRVFPFDFTKDGERIELEGRYIVSVNDSNAYLAAGLAGLGIILGPTFMVQQHVARGELVPVLAEWWSEPIPVHVVYPPNRHMSTKVRIFVDWVADLFASHDLIQRRTTLPNAAARAPSSSPLPEPAQV
jgi:LysR family transcriptional regulator, regulator for bpeEF and oprC